MLGKYASLLIAVLLVVLATTACIVRTAPARRGQPVYVEDHDHKKHKHKKHKHKKHKKHR